MKEFDELTGLYTREAFCVHAEMLVKDNPHTVYDIVLSDFVNFKHFNERFGTKTGDFLLIKTGEMLSKSGPDVICGRYGADRFVSIVPHLDSMGIAFLENFQLPAQANDELPVTSIVVKFGVCNNVTSDLPISVYCDRAYMAVQSVKHQYGKNVGIYDEFLGKNIHQELIMEENMKNALDTHQFVVYYQPKLDLSNERTCGAEALVRWLHPTLGFMNPGVFIPLFEKNGFITPLDFYVLNQVCQDLTRWQEKGIPVVPISINVSRKDFENTNLPERIIQIVDQYHLDHSLIHIEVTESCFDGIEQSMLRDTELLRDAGFMIELDDFGSGYTSLSSLNDMKIDILKLDISMLKKDKPTLQRSILSFALQLADILNLKTIQEGVETKEEYERLRDLGCDYIQGYYYSKPLSCVEFEEFLFK